MNKQRSGAVFGIWVDCVPDVMLFMGGLAQRVNTNRPHNVGSSGGEGQARRRQSQLLLLSMERLCSCKSEVGTCGQPFQSLVNLRLVTRRPVQL